MSAAEPDFSAFYYAASVILDPDISITEVYNPNPSQQLVEKYGINQPVKPYIYSIAVAYILTPLTLFSYQTAKVVWNLLNIAMYVVAILIPLRLGRASGIYALLLVCLGLVFAPFLRNQFWMQTSVFVFLLVSCAVYLMTKGRFYMSGILLGVATLFKIYPIAVAMVFLFKNWRIPLTTLIVILGSFLIPGSLNWIQAMYNVGRYYSEGYVLLGPSLFVVFVAIVIFATALIAFRFRELDYQTLATLAIPAGIIILPVIEFHFLTVLMFPIIYLLSLYKDDLLLLKIIVLVSIALISAWLKFPGSLVLWCAICLWVILTNKINPDLHFNSGRELSVNSIR
ncbi:MAG: DUF2029 domain-containing protein [Clostridiales bacterium]|nr:DUF2029 domain-containing protein [Clostridiales bacterium]